jgi:hypothetical protein
MSKKKAPKKAKKKSPKKKSKKSNFLAEAPKEHYFYVCDGSVVKSLVDLAFSLDSMPDGVFYFHVNDQKNDFATWVKEIIKQDDLSDRMLGVLNKIELQAMLLKYILEKVL